jgi:phage gp29-like protein
MNEEGPKDPRVVPFSEFQRRKETQAFEIAKAQEDLAGFKAQVARYLEVLENDLREWTASGFEIPDEDKDNEIFVQNVTRAKQKADFLSEAIPRGRALLERTNLTREELSEFVQSVNSQIF